MIQCHAWQTRHILLSMLLMVILLASGFQRSQIMQLLILICLILECRYGVFTLNPIYKSLILIIINGERKVCMCCVTLENVYMYLIGLMLKKK